MTEPLFRSVDSASIAADIRAAQYSVCYAAPGILQEPANAMADAEKKIGPVLIGERVMRMSFGSFDLKSRERGMWE